MVNTLKFEGDLKKVHLVLIVLIYGECQPITIGSLENILAKKKKKL